MTKWDILFGVWIALKMVLDGISLAYLIWRCKNG